ncbi:anti-sigma factor family protein [Streptomyces sp. t39]|uniref:anti-sigma factor family protein n=1 Tax=Streptomyces sp. t39 TaxID=1828156 RepID=UPI0011CD6EAB|nr:zf-HC2 domain-containing protein [Streptomyces sp. t39]TXS56769.1 zf-HC2 domain-containing protein [Streptomyces sp. t39]
MNGTGPTPAEQHLGDRLAALVDGELGHDARDRVLAHLATCHKCKAEADAQRRLKSVFAQSAPPPLSEGLLARLQGLPAEPAGGDSPQGPFGGRPADTVYGALTPSAEHPRGRRGEAFGYVPGGSHAAALPGAGGGFRIHEVGRAEAERSPWRGRRFAFAAASAVSFAAIALGGAVPVDMSGETSSRGQNGGNKVSPARTGPGTGVSTGASQNGGTTLRASEGERRRGGSRADTGASAAVAPTAPPVVLGRTPPFTASILMYDSAALPPLIRPAGPTLQLASASALPPAVAPQHTGAAPAVPATAAAYVPRTSPLTPLR